MQYIAGVNLDNISLCASDKFLRRIQSAFIKYARKDIKSDVFDTLDSKRILYYLNEYCSIQNISPLYMNPDVNYKLSNKCFEQANNVYQSIIKVKNSSPYILCLKLACYIDILLFLVTKLGRNQLTELYTHVEKEFHATLKALKNCPQQNEEPPKDKQYCGLIFLYNSSSAFQLNASKLFNIGKLQNGLKNYINNL